MTTPDRRVRVFVSSRMEELAAERELVKRVLGELHVAAWVFEEDAGARSTTVRQTYLDALDKSDLYIGLFWKSWGEYTFDEFRHAREKLRMDCLIYEKHPANDQREPRLQQFLDEIGQVEAKFGVTPRRFADLQELDRYLREDVQAWQADKIHERSTSRLDYMSQAPPLGDRYVDRLIVLNRLKESLLPSPDDRKNPVTWAVLFGAPGVGKTVLASAFAQDEEVSRAFPDGVLWLSLGEHPDLKGLLTNLGRTILDPQLTGQGYADVEAAVGRLRSLMHDRAYLLVVDDAWEPEHISKAFLIGGPRCLLLVTTRQERIATKIGAERVDLAPMVEKEAIELMSRWAGPISETDDSIARKIANEVGYLPLALELIGARVGALGGWPAYAERWRQQRLGVLTRERDSRGREDSVRDSLELSLKLLSEEDRERYVRLGVFSRKVLFPASAAATLWGCDLWQTADLLSDLAGQAVLFQRETEAGFRYGFHDLLYDLVLEKMGATGLLQAQETLLEGYRSRSQAGWPSVSDDGYFFDHLSYHLIQAKRCDELVDLLTASPDWMNAKAATMGTDSSFAVDVDRALGVESDTIKVVKLHAVRQVIRERLGWISDTDLRTLVWRDRVAQALSQARLRPDPASRFGSMIAVYEELGSRGDPRPELLDEAEAMARSIGQGDAKADALRVVGKLRQSIGDARWSSSFDEARRAADSAEKESMRWKALLGLADTLSNIDIARSRQTLDAARAAAEQMTENFNRSEALRDIALAYARTGRGPEALETLKTHESYRFEDAVQEVLLALHQVGALSRMLAEQVFTLFDRRFEMDKAAGKSISACIHALTGDRDAYEAMLSNWSDTEQFLYLSKPRRCLVSALAAVGDFEEALRELMTISAGGDYADALADIVRAAEKRGYAGIDRIVSEAAPLILSKANLESFGKEFGPAIRTGRLLVQVGKARTALELIRRLREDGMALGLNELLPELDRIDVGNRLPLLEEAGRMIREIQSDYWREGPLRALALAFAKVRDERADSLLKQAWSVANSRDAKYPPKGVLLGVGETFAIYGSLQAVRRIIGTLESIPTRVDALCWLARLLFDRGDKDYAEVLAEALDTAQSMERKGDRVGALIALIGVLGHANDSRWRSLTDEAEDLARSLPNSDLFPDSDVELVPQRRASQNLARLTDCLTALSHYDEALRIAQYIPREDVSCQRLAHIAKQLSNIGDPRSNEVFEQAKALLTKSDSRVGFAESARVLIFALAGAGRIDEAIEVARIDFREEDRSNTLASFTRTLIEAGRLKDAGEIAHAIAGPHQRAEALVNLAVGLARQGDEGSRRLLDEVSELAQTTELPDRRASVLHELVRGLAWMGELAEAERTAGMISLYEFRADAFREIAEVVLESSPDRARELLQLALTGARAIPDESRRQRLMTSLVDTLAFTQGLRQGLEALETDSFDEFIGTLVRWAPLFEKVNSEVPLTALREAIGVAGWIRPDWQKVHDCILESGSNAT